MAAVSWDTNMAAMTSCENTQYLWSICRGLVSVMACGGLRHYRRLSASDVFRRSRTPQTCVPHLLKRSWRFKEDRWQFFFVTQEKLQNLQKVSGIVWAIWTITITIFNEDVTIAVPRSQRPWIYIDCIRSFGSWTLRTAATNNNFGEFAVNALSIKWILVTKVQSRNILEKLQQHPQCMMVWLNSTSIVSPAIFSNQVLIYGVLR